jgi:hypothetical protein
MSTLLYLSDGGVTSALEGWGAALRQYYHTNHDLAGDVTAEFLSYWSVAVT